MPLYDVFLSHASADKPAVEHLARKLREEGLEPFLDKWHLVPGERWIRRLDDALADSDSFAVFIGARSGGGAWRTREVELALDRAATEASFRIIPVLLPGGDDSALDELSKFLGLHTWVDFRAGLNDEDAFHRLVSGIRGKAPGPGGGGGGGQKPTLPYRCMAPAREPFVQRSEYAKVRDALLAGTTVGITTAIYGAGGFGKTALAVELCYDEQVREKYPDGILWTTIGEEINDAGRLARVRDLIRWWTEENPPAFETVSAASAHLRAELNGKRVLLVVDDVWRPEDVTPFQGLAALLVTTRDSRTLPAESVPFHVDALEVSEAVRLLGSGLSNGTGVDLRPLAKRLGEWPLLLKIVNRQLRELIQQDGLSTDLALKEVNEALDTEGLTVFDLDREDSESRGRAVVQTVGASLRRLSGEEVGQFEQFAIFPEDKDIPLPVLEKLWGLGAFATKKLCARLHDLSLLLRFDRAAGSIRLHDVIRSYLVKKGEGHLAEWHRQLLDAFLLVSGHWSDLPREEGYLWSHLVHHMIGAGQSDGCRELLLDFHYLSAKLMIIDINALLADYSSFAENDEEIRLVRDALRLSANVLARNPVQLREQLWGRLLDRREAGICSLVLAAGEPGTHWLRPRKASLSRPGGALIRTIDHPRLAITLAVFPDGRVVSGSFDETLRVWDLESGKTLQTLEEHSDVIGSLAVLDSYRVISGSAGGTLRVWDVESGKALQTLKGHSAWISAVAVLDSRRVVSGYEDGTLRLWDVENGQILRTLEGQSGWVRGLAILDSRRVVSGSDDGTLRVWDVESGEILQTFEGHPNGVSTLAVLDSRLVVSGSVDRTLRVWDVESGRTLQTLEGHSGWISAVAVLGIRRVVTGSDDGTLRVWDVESGQTLQILEGHSNSVRVVAVLDGRRVVSGSADETLRVWDVEGDKTLQTLEGHSGRIRAVAVWDSRRVVSGSDDGTLRVWDVESGQTLQTLEGCSDWVRAVAVLDSRRVVSGSSDGRLQVWDVESGQTLQTLEGHSAGVGAVAVLDSRRVVSGSADGTFRVWDIEKGRTLQRFRGLYRLAPAVAVLDSNRVVVSVSDSHSLWVWDIGRKQILQVLKGHSSVVIAAAALDSRRVVSGSYDRTLRVWDVESGEVECLFTLDSPVTAVAVMPHCRIIVAGDQSGRVHFFDFIEP